MSRRDIEELLKQLREAGQASASSDVVTLEMPLFRQALDGLERLEQALDNRPSLIKKLNEKIIKLEGELEVLREQTRVSELERKVQRLEAELQRSYATKNFTLKNGLLEIEKAYRDFISASPAVQGLWDEITLLLVEDKEAVPAHIQMRRNATASRAVTEDSPTIPPAPEPGVFESGPPTATSFVQRQVDKFKDYTWTPGTIDPHEYPNHLTPLSAYPHYFPGHPGAGGGSGSGDEPPAAAPPEEGQAALDAAALAALRSQYDSIAAAAAAAGSPMTTVPHWGSMAPEPSPLRPVSLFGAGGSEGKPADASAADAVRDVISASLEPFRALFAQFDWAPKPPPAAGGAAAGEAHSAAAGDAAASSSSALPRVPDASAFSAIAESLDVSVDRLRAYFAQMRWAAGAAGGAGGSAAQGPGAASGGPLTPDARYFDAQADAILASVLRLRAQFQDAADAAAAAAAAEGGVGGGGATWTGGAGGTAPGGGGAAAGGTVIPDARYFKTQAEAITASLDELLRLYQRSSNADAVALLSAGGANARNWPAAAAPTGAAAVTLPALTPDARASDAVGDAAGGAVQPLVDLFSSFLSYMDEARGSSGASGPWPWFGGHAGAAPPAAAASTSAAGGEGEGDGTGSGGGNEALSAADLVRLFAQYARAWPGSAAAAAAFRRGQGPTSAPGAGTGGGAADLTPVTAGWVSPLGTRPIGDVEVLAPSVGRGEAPNGVGSAAAGSAAPAVRFRISVNTADAGAGVLSAHISAAPSAASLAGAAAGGAGGASAAEAGTPPATAEAGGGSLPSPSPWMSPSAATAGGRATPQPPPSPSVAAVDVLLASLESRHGRGLSSSPEAVAVWRDLLRLLGVDPDSRPLPGGRSAAATPTPGAAPPARAAPPMPSGPEADSAGATAGSAAASREPGQAEEAGAGPAGVTDRWREAGVLETAAPPAAAGARKSVDGAAARDGLGSGSASGESALAEGHVRSAVEAYDEDAAADAAAAGAQARDWEGAVGARSSLTGSRTSGTDSRARTPRGSAHGEGEGSDAAGTSAGIGGGATDGSEQQRQTPSRAYRSSSEADAVAGTSEEPSASTAGDDAVAAAAAAGSEGTEASRRQKRRVTGAEEGADGDGAEGPPAGGGGGGGGEWDWAGDEAAAAATGHAPAPADDGGGPGLVAGGVRFQITLSEIVPAEEGTSQEGGQLPPMQDSAEPGSTQPQLLRLQLQQQQQQQEQQQLAQVQAQESPVLQFRALVGGGEAEAEAAARAEAEVAQLRQVRAALSEQLSATQELVLHLNRQLKGALEGREDMAARAERLNAELSAAMAATSEARAESDAFMRDLVETKVQLAEVQGEYMQVYQALKRALSNEKDMMAKIDELERILAVVGPGDVALEEDYGHSVGRVAAAGGASRGSGGGGVSGTVAGPDLAAAVAAAVAAAATPDEHSQGHRHEAHGYGQGQRQGSGRRSEEGDGAHGPGMASATAPPAALAVAAPLSGQGPGSATAGRQSRSSTDSSSDAHVAE